MSQKTYQRSKLLIQVNILAIIESLLSWIISLANAESLFKIIFAIKSLFVKDQMTKFELFQCNCNIQIELPKLLKTA